MSRSRSNTAASKGEPPADILARAVLKQGALEKLSSGLVKRWQQRFFKLYAGGVLVYQEQSNGKASGWYELSGATVEAQTAGDPCVLLVQWPASGTMLSLRTASAGGAAQWRPLLVDATGPTQAVRDGDSGRLFAAAVESTIGKRGSSALPAHRGSAGATMDKRGSAGGASKRGSAGAAKRGSAGAAAMTRGERRRQSRQNSLKNRKQYSLQPNGEAAARDGGTGGGGGGSVGAGGDGWAAAAAASAGLAAAAVAAGEKKRPRFSVPTRSSRTGSARASLGAAATPAPGGVDPYAVKIDIANHTVNPMNRNQDAMNAMPPKRHVSRAGSARSSLGSRLTKLKASAVKPFQPGWKPRSTTLRRLPGETWPQYTKRNKWFLMWLFIALLGLLLALAAYLAPCDPILTSFQVPTNVTQLVQGEKTVQVATTQNITVNYTAPTELSIVLDGSGSIGAANWPQEVEAGRTFAREYSNAALALGSALQTSVVQFSGSGRGGGATAGSAKVEVTMQPSISGVLNEMNALKDTNRYLTGGTYFGPGLVAAYETLLAAAYTGANAKNAPRPGTKPFRFILFVSDGGATDIPGTYGSGDASGVFPFCRQHGLLTGGNTGTCTVADVAGFIRGQGVVIKGVFVGGSANGQTELCGISTCTKPGQTGQQCAAGCSYFTAVDNLAALGARAKDIAESLAEQVSTSVRTVQNQTIVTRIERTVEENVTTVLRTGTKEAGCKEAGWFALLLLLLPLLWYLLFIPVRQAWDRVLDAREQWTQDELDLAAAEDSELPTTGMYSDAPLPAPAEAEHVSPAIVTSRSAQRPIGQRYKWKIEAAEAYLWAGSAGTTPMGVNFGRGKDGARVMAPPSMARQDAATKKFVPQSKAESAHLAYAAAQDAKVSAQEEARRARDAEARAAAAARLRVAEEQERLADERALAAARDAAAGVTCCQRLAYVFCCPCRACLRCLPGFINDLAHFIAFYFPACVGCCIVDAHEERRQAANDQRRQAANAALLKQQASATGGAAPPDSLTNVVQEDPLGGTSAGHVLHSDATDRESSGEEEPGADGPFGALITERDVMARYSLMHYKHPDCTVGRVTKARQAGTGWEAMIVWYNADGSAEPMSDWDDETTSEGALAKQFCTALAAVELNGG
eukprot:g2514.t1